MDMTVKTILVDDSKTVAELTKAVCDRIGECSGSAALAVIVLVLIQIAI